MEDGLTWWSELVTTVMGGQWPPPWGLRFAEGRHAEYMGGAITDVHRLSDITDGCHDFRPGNRSVDSTGPLRRSG
jgi:hypothetical protein